MLIHGLLERFSKKNRWITNFGKNGFSFFVIHNNCIGVPIFSRYFLNLMVLLAQQILGKLHGPEMSCALSIMFTATFLNIGYQNGFLEGHLFVFFPP